MTNQPTAGAALAVAAQAKAAVEARWLVATHQPRNLEAVRLELLRECERPSFAEAAIYVKPIGQGIEGLSIRFVEAAMASMGNMDSEVVTIFDDKEKRIVEVRVTDFQRNVGHRKQITITKTVERLYLQKHQVPISQRTNSGGKTTYTVEATEDDLLNKEGALTSKAIRTCGLRLIPGWLQDECEQIIRKTKADAAARDPDAELRKLLDGFGQIGVMPDELEAYLAHPIAQIVPAEIVQLRDIWKTIQAAETTWAETLAHRQHLRGQAPEPITEASGAAPAAKPAAKPAQAAKGSAAVKAAMASQGKPPAAPPAPPVAPKVTAPPAQSPETTTAPPKEVTTVDPAQAKLDAERAATKADVEKRAEEKPGEKAQRPSRTKAAKAERAEEIAPWMAPGANDKVVRVYIDGGDLRNKAKAIAIHSTWKAKQDANSQDANSQEDHPSPPTDEEIADSFGTETSTEPDGTVINSETGEVLSEPDEPAWMREGPPTSPPGEGF